MLQTGITIEKLISGFSNFGDGSINYLKKCNKCHKFLHAGIHFIMCSNRKQYYNECKTCLSWKVDTTKNKNCKRCTACKVIRPKTLFHKDGTKNDKLCVHCKMCRKINHKNFTMYSR